MMEEVPIVDLMDMESDITIMREDQFYDVVKAPLNTQHLKLNIGLVLMARNLSL